VTIVVPFPPGGGTDTGARIVGQKLSVKWGQPVTIDNKGGAAGQVGADFVAKAKPDGYTLLMGNVGTQSINPALYKKLPYDPDKAFAPISLVAELPLAMMVNPSVPAKSDKEFIALAKSQLWRRRRPSLGC
jgi:tripartite-type tricarboxylate transporter receptor subunit TctC